MPDQADLEQEVHLWYLPTARFDDEHHLARAAERLSSDEQDRARRFAFEKDRRSYIAAHWLLRSALSQYLPVEPSAWEFTRSLFGKPAISGPPQGRRIAFNLSHSPGMVACAVTKTGEVGVDVETVRPREFLKLAERFFAPGEFQELKRLPEHERARAFFRFWTLKEAYVKARGRGLSLDLSGFFFPDVLGNEIRIEFDEGWDDDPNDWQFYRHEPDDQNQIASAVHKARCKNVVWRVFSEIPTG